MFFIAFAFKGQVPVFAGQLKIVTCKSLVLQDKSNIEIICPRWNFIKELKENDHGKFSYNSFVKLSLYL